MPHFYLHVCNGDGFSEDDEGIDLPSLEAARAKAIEGLRDIMAGEMRGGQINMGSFIEIEDENHALVMTVPFPEAVQILDRPGQGRQR